MSSLQVVLLSATMPAEVLEVTKKFMREPIRILVKKEELTLEGIKQFYINVEREVRFNIAEHNTAACLETDFHSCQYQMSLLSKAPCSNCRSRASQVQLLWMCKHGYAREGE